MTAAIRRRAPFLLALTLVFGCLLLFDTQALLQIGWDCLRGGCGVGARWAVPVALATIGVVCLLGAGARRPARRKPATPRRNQPGKRPRKAVPACQPAARVRRPRRRPSPAR